jgi:(p)ppGpp synthase/HD superfamily hydrolase
MTRFEIERISRAADFAALAHKGQKRRGGEDYITHPIAVANAMETTLEKMVALLHDTIEDTGTTSLQLQELFGAEVAEGVWFMTKGSALGMDESYLDYLLRVKKNETARRVKIEDIKHNLLTTEHKNHRRQYELAIHILEN